MESMRYIRNILVVFGQNDLSVYQLYVSLAAESSEAGLFYFW